MNECQQVITKIKKSLTTEESLIELLILVGLSCKQRVKIENVQSNYQYENVFKPLITDIDNLNLNKDGMINLLIEIGKLLANAKTPF